MTSRDNSKRRLGRLMMRLRTTLNAMKRIVFGRGDGEGDAGVLVPVGRGPGPRHDAIALRLPEDD